MSRQDSPNRSMRTGDMGCSLYPDCLTCPFPDCKYDLPNGEQSLKVQVLAGKAAWLRKQGLNWAAVAKQLCVPAATLLYARKKYDLG